MTQEEKQLLLIDLCSRLPYGVIMTNKKLKDTYYPLDGNELQQAYYDDDWDDVPYLRSMSSMTDEEKNELGRISCEGNIVHKYGIFYRSQDYLNSIHVDYRGLIPKGLAIEAPEGMYE